MTNQWFSPAKIYAELQKDEQKTMRTATPEGNMVEAAKTQHKVIVTETGEAVLQPDVAKVSILYKSTKVRIFSCKSYWGKMGQFGITCIQVCPKICSRSSSW